MVRPTGTPLAMLHVLAIWSRPRVVICIAGVIRIVRSVSLVLLALAVYLPFDVLDIYGPLRQLFASHLDRFLY